MKTVMLAAMHSGAGKTIACCAILSAFRKRGMHLQAFKAGPDYIDPMFHRSALEIPSRNLDLYLQGEDGVLATLSRTEADLAVLEGAMGYYDGLNSTDRYSAWELARLTNTPAVLVLRPKQSSLSLAAQVCGMIGFRPESGIRALLLTDCSARSAERFRPMLEKETGLPVLGFLPSMPEARLPERHLGLMTAAEVADLSVRLERLADQAEENIDLDSLLALAGVCETRKTISIARPAVCRIAVARDEAFCFLYEDNLDLLRQTGAELCFFSPLHDAYPPDADGLYLPGGYPELFACLLSENTGMRAAVGEMVREGLPTVAECGGFLYLQQKLESDSGESFPMCGVLPGNGYRTGKLQRFGYALLRSAEDSLLFHAGEQIPVHEFHYWDSTQNGSAFCCGKSDGRHWSCGYASESLYAAFPHLHFGGKLPLAERFVKACEKWKASMK